MARSRPLAAEGLKKGMAFERSGRSMVTRTIQVLEEHGSRVLLQDADCPRLDPKTMKPPAGSERRGRGFPCPRWVERAALVGFTLEDRTP